MRSVSVLGCGWLGLPLAVRLLEEGFSVRGSSRDPGKLPGLKEKGMEPYLVNLDPGMDGEGADRFLSSDILFVNFPPPRRDDAEVYHERQIGSLLDAIPEPEGKWIIFAGSTSVYPNTNGVVREGDAVNPDKPSGKALLRAEKALFGHPETDTTVIRFSGLVGYDRAPINSIRKKKLVLDPDCPLNLIHRDDCVGIVLRTIALDARNTTFNATCDGHPTRREYYSREALRLGVELPAFESGGEKARYKIVSNEKLKKTLGYNFVYPDPLEMERKRREPL